MLVVTRAYDDNTAYIYDTVTMLSKLFEEIELIRFGSNHEVLGLELNSTGRAIQNIESYKILQFENEEALNEYIYQFNLCNIHKFYDSNNHVYVLLIKTNNKIHVDYVIYYPIGPTKVYKTERGYAENNPCAAKAYTKTEAKQKAALMRKNSKTGKYWTTEKIFYEQWQLGIT